VDGWRLVEAGWRLVFECLHHPPFPYFYSISYHVYYYRWRLYGVVKREIGE
jgi:hypothetical protein